MFKLLTFSCISIPSCSLLHFIMFNYVNAKTLNYFRLFLYMYNILYISNNILEIYFKGGLFYGKDYENNGWQ